MLLYYQKQVFNSKSMLICYLLARQNQWTCFYTKLGLEYY